TVWLPSLRPSFIDCRADLANGRVPTTLVIEHLDVVEQLHLGLAVAAEPFSELKLDRREEALHDGVVVTVAATAHAAGNTVRLEHGAVIFAGIGGALVRVVHQTEVGTPPFQSHVERPHRQMSIIDSADRPT